MQIAIFNKSKRCIDKVVQKFEGIQNKVEEDSYLITERN